MRSGSDPHVASWDSQLFSQSKVRMGWIYLIKNKVNGNPSNGFIWKRELKTAEAL